MLLSLESTKEEEESVVVVTGVRAVDSNAFSNKVSTEGKSLGRRLGGQAPHAKGTLAKAEGNNSEMALPPLLLLLLLPLLPVVWKSSGSAFTSSPAAHTKSPLLAGSSLELRLLMRLSTAIEYGVS